MIECLEGIFTFEYKRTSLTSTNDPAAAHNGRKEDSATMFKNLFGAHNTTQATNTLQGYLRASNQIEAINQQLEDAVNTAILHGTAPWDAYIAVGYALAFVRACRCHVIVVQAIVQAPTPNTSLPRDAYNQAIALCTVFEPLLEEAIKAQEPRYRPRGFVLPLQFGPRLQESNDHISIPLVQGLRNGAQQLQEWVNGFIAAYELAVNASRSTPPEPVGQHLEAVHREMQLGMFHFQTAVDMLGALSITQVAQPMLAQASDLLWEALSSFFTISQLVAHPGAFTQPHHPGRRPETEPTPQHIPCLPANTGQPSVPEPEKPYGAQEAAALLNDLAQVPKRTWQPPQGVAQPQAESMLDEFVQVAQHQPQPTSDDDLLADITQKPPVSSKRQQRDNDTDDLLSTITDGDREPLL